MDNASERKGGHFCLGETRFEEVRNNGIHKGNLVTKPLIK